MRRAVSAAYYALFHLLIYEASRLVAKERNIVGLIARSYGHSKMLDVSKAFANGRLPRKLNPWQAILNKAPRRPTVAKLEAIAQAFLDMQQARHDADYNLLKIFSRGEAKDLVALAEAAFSDWQTIRDDDLARVYLACFLVFDDWNKER